MSGIVVNGEVNELVLRVPYDRDIHLGEMLMLEDEVFRERKYLLRVTSIAYGYEAAEADWAERAAGSIILMDGKEEYRLYHRERRLYKAVTCAPMLTIEGGEIKGVKSLPSHFSSVRDVEAGDYDLLRGALGDIPIGKLRSGEREIEVEVGIHGKAFPYHIGIFATTGMGKSNLMRVLAASTMKNGKYGMLIFDPHGEYYHGPEKEKKGLKHLRSSRLRAYTSREEAGISRLRISYTEIYTSDMASIYSLSEAQREALFIFSARYGDKWLMQVHTKDVDELVQEFPNIHENTLRVLKRRVDSIMKMDVISRDPDFSVSNQIISELMNGKAVLVDTSGLAEEEELLISSALARKVFNKWKSVFTSNKDEFDGLPPVLITLEEAQRVLSEAKGGMFPRIAREGRKFKVGLCAISQQPKLIHPHILTQLNTLFIMGLSDEGDRRIMESASKQDMAPLRNEIKSLNVGEAIITSPFAPFPIPIKIYDFDEYAEDCREERREIRLEHDEAFV